MSRLEIPANFERELRVPCGRTHGQWRSTSEKDVFSCGILPCEAAYRYPAPSDGMGVLDQGAAVMMETITLIKIRSLWHLPRTTLPLPPCHPCFLFIIFKVLYKVLCEGIL